MKKQHLSIFAAAVAGGLVGYVVSGIPTETPPTDADPVSYNLETRVVGVYEDASQHPTGLIATSQRWPTVVVSPWLVASENQERVAYAVWDAGHYGIVIYVSDMDGDNARIVAKQSVPEGQGELDTSSLVWIDNRTIRYQESAVTYQEGAFGKELLTWLVDIESGEKIQIENL